MPLFSFLVWVFTFHAVDDLDPTRGCASPLPQAYAADLALVVLPVLAGTFISTLLARHDVPPPPHAVTRVEGLWMPIQSSRSRLLTTGTSPPRPNLEASSLMRLPHANALDTPMMSTDIATTSFPVTWIDTVISFTSSITFRAFHFLVHILDLCSFHTPSDYSRPNEDRRPPWVSRPRRVCAKKDRTTFTGGEGESARRSPRRILHPLFNSQNSLQSWFTLRAMPKSSSAFYPLCAWSNGGPRSDDRWTSFQTLTEPSWEAKHRNRPPRIGSSRNATVSN